MTREQFESEATRGPGGAWTWNANGGAPFDDLLAEVGVSAEDRAATARLRLEQVAAFAEEYRRNWRPPSPETLAEMRAEFGPGARVVDVMAGRVITIPDAWPTPPPPVAPLAGPKRER